MATPLNNMHYLFINIDSNVSAFWVVQQLQPGILVSVVNLTESRLAWETVSGNAGWGITMLLFTELGIPLHQVLALLPAWDAGLYTWRKAAEL